MIKVLFICHGNICRSPMAQCIFQYMVDQQGYHDDFRIDSAATSREEIGNPIYPPACSILHHHHIPLIDHHARQFSKDEYDQWDHIFVMDHQNFRNMMGIVKDNEHKISMLSEQSIEDPWYTDDFETAYRQIYEGCSYWFDQLIANIERK